MVPPLVSSGRGESSRLRKPSPLPLTGDIGLGKNCHRSYLFVRVKHILVHLSRGDLKRKLKSHLMELAKQLIGFIVKTICFSQRNLDCGSWFDWLRQKSFAPKCVHLGKNKVFPKWVSHLRVDTQSQKQPLLASTARSFLAFLHQNEKVIGLERGKWWVEQKDCLIRWNSQNNYFVSSSQMFVFLNETLTVA